MSAIAENGSGPQEVLQVLFALYPKFGALDFTGPLEVLNYAQHSIGDPCEYSIIINHTIHSAGDRQIVLT